MSHIYFISIGGFKFTTIRYNDKTAIFQNIFYSCHKKILEKNFIVTLWGRHLKCVDWKFWKNSGITYGHCLTHFCDNVFFSKFFECSPLVLSKQREKRVARNIVIKFHATVRIHTVRIHTVRITETQKIKTVLQCNNYTIIRKRAAVVYKIPTFF